MADYEDLDWYSKLERIVSQVVGRWHRQIDGLADILLEALHDLWNGRIDQDGLMAAMPTALAPNEAKQILIQISWKLRER
jgi:hypothetical protein